MQRPTRERWFFAQGAQRRGPFTLAEIVTALGGAPDPRAVLVWRKGLREWTLAEAVPEIAQRLVPAPTAEPAVRGEAAPEPRAGTPAMPPALTRLRIGFALAAAVAGITAVVLQFRAPGAAPGPAAAASPVAATPAPGAHATAGAAAPATPAPAPAIRGSATPAAASQALAAEEAELPVAELRKLRGVAAWSGDTLKLTIYNATAWRLTELQVRLERLSGEDFVADERPTTLVPPAQRVDVGVADLLARVAPDRKKPGLNALDTGVFEARAGAAPEGFRWELESARGYPPLR